MKIIRELGNAEYLYHLYNKIASTNFSIIIELNKHIEFNDLKISTNTIMNNHEIFCSKITKTNKTKIVFEKNNKHNYSIEQISGSKEDLNSIVEKNINTKFKNENIPLQIIEFTDEQTNTINVIFTFNHIFTDANSAILISQKIILSAYNKNYDIKEPKQTVLPNLESLMPKSVTGYSFIRILFKFIIKNIYFRFKFGQQTPIGKEKYNFNSRNIKIYKFILDREQFKFFTENCRKHNLTVHYVLSAIQMNVLRNENHSKGLMPISLLSPINLRDKLIPQINPNTPGLYIAIPKLNIAINSDENILLIARKIKKELLEQIYNNEIFILWKLFNKSKFPCEQEGLNNFEMFSSNKSTSTMITNVGVVPDINPNKLENPINTIQFAVAPSKDVSLCSAVCSYGNRMIINYCVNTDLISNDISAELIEKMINKILTF